MRGRIVISALGKFPVYPFRPRPSQVWKFAVRWIHDNASSAWCQKISVVALETVVGAPGIRLVHTREVRFSIRGRSNGFSLGRGRLATLATHSLGRRDRGRQRDE